MTGKKLKSTLLVTLICTSLFALTPEQAAAATDYLLSKGQTVYVPVYSNIYTAPKEVPIHLANIIAIRNTDIHNPLQVTSADYYDTKGTFVKKHYQKPVILAPMETTYIYLSERDQEGGFGANFIIRWQAEQEINAPIIECLMVGNQGRAFVSPGQVIKENTR